MDRNNVYGVGLKGYFLKRAPFGPFYLFCSLVVVCWANNEKELRF